MLPWLLLLSLLVACGGGGATPETETACNDGEDEDADGTTDCDDTDCATAPECPQLEVCTGGADEDADTFIDCEDDDCWGDPACFKIDDDTDLPGPNGDPALDIDKFSVTLASGTATFFSTFDAPWPPSTTFYSYYLRFEIANDGNTPVAVTTVQRHDGVDDIIEQGIPANAVTVRQTPRGVWVRMVGVQSIGEKYYVESGIQKSNPGTRVTDYTVSAPAPLP
jgi:hypothetical protein